MYYCDAYATLPILLRSIKKQTIIIYEKLLDYRCLCLLVSIPHVCTVATNKQLLVLECLHWLRFRAQCGDCEEPAGGSKCRCQPGRGKSRQIALFEWIAVARTDVQALSGNGRQLCERRYCHFGRWQGYAKRKLWCQCAMGGLERWQDADGYHGCRLRHTNGGIRYADFGQHHQGADCSTLCADTLHARGRTGQSHLARTGFHYLRTR